MSQSSEWNRPVKGGNNKGNGARGGSRTHLRALAAALIVVAGGSLALWLIQGEKRDEKTVAVKEPKKSSIVEVKPQIATEVLNAEDDEKPRDSLPQRVGEVRDGKVLMPDGELRIVKGEVTNSNALVKAPYAIFRHSSENILAGLMVAEPGKIMVGTPRYNGVFTKNFLKSLEEPIIIKETDDEDVKALKRAVNEAKIELKAAYDRGEDIEQIVLDSRAEFQRLAAVREEMKRNVLQMANESAQSIEDVDDLVSAANKMLEAKGIAPLDETPLMNTKLRFMKEQELNNSTKEDAE